MMIATHSIHNRKHKKGKEENREEEVAEADSIPCVLQQLPPPSRDRSNTTWKKGIITHHPPRKDAMGHTHTQQTQ
jgi:hypothetical protein